RLAFQCDRAGEAPMCGLDLRERVERVDVARKAGESGVILALCGCEPPARPVQLAELDVGPREGFALTDRRVEGKPHRGDRTAPIAEELARVRDPRIGSETRA